jgi:glycosyltransferase involved in cell wall biosynthesis
VRTAAVIPARNEGETIGDVVAAAAASPLVDEIIVIDGRSEDGTGVAATASGARVLVADEDGKGEAMAAGVAATDAELICFLDGDLTGLRPYHVDRLVRTVASGSAAMACGLFDRGPLLNRIFLHLMPILTGERALRRDLFESLEAADFTGSRIEAALNSRAAELGLPVAAFVCTGMFHRVKEDMYPTRLQGFAAKSAMLLTAMWSYVRYWAARRIRGAFTRRPQRPA